MVIKSADIAKLFDEIRDQRDAAKQHAEAAEARAAQLEAERDALRVKLEQIRAEALGHFERVKFPDAETQAWLLDIAQELERIKP